MKANKGIVQIILICSIMISCHGPKQISPDDQFNYHSTTLERAQQSVALALEYHDQGGYELSARLFIEAADLFAELKLKDEERRALVAAAKMQIKHSQKQAFLFTMARYKGLLQRYEMPAEDERLLINLSDHLKSAPLTYPVKSDWKLIFDK